MGEYLLDILGRLMITGVITGDIKTHGSELRGQGTIYEFTH